MAAFTKHLFGGLRLLPTVGGFALTAVDAGILSVDALAPNNEEMFYGRCIDASSTTNIVHAGMTAFPYALAWRAGASTVSNLARGASMYFGIAGLVAACEALIVAPTLLEASQRIKKEYESKKRVVDRTYNEDGVLSGVIRVEDLYTEGHAKNAQRALRSHVVTTALDAMKCWPYALIRWTQYSRVTQISVRGLEHDNVCVQRSYRKFIDSLWGA